jgi:glutathione S-transferase
MKLIYMPGTCALASHIALIWSGENYELERLKYEDAHGPAFMALNPKGAVPALIISESGSKPVVLTESLAVLLYIAQQHPTLRLGPDSNQPMEQIRMHEMMSELVSEVHKAFVPTFVPDRFVTDDQAHDSVRAAAYILIEKAFRRLDGYLEGQDWLVLQRRTVADAYLHALSRWLAKTPTPVDTFPNVERHFHRLAGDAGVQRALNEETAVV